MFLKNIIKLKKSFIICTFLIIPNVLLAFVNINFIPTENGIDNLISKEEPSGKLKLELMSLQDDQYTSISDPITLDTGLTLSRVVFIPISLNNSQITNKIIIIPTEKGASGEKFSSIYIMDADLKNQTSSTVTTTEIRLTPIVIKNNNGIFLICASHNNTSTDSLIIYKVDTDNNSVQQIQTPSPETYQDIENIIPLDKNTIIIVEQTADLKIVAHVYSISEQETIHSYTLNTDSNLKVEYNPTTFQTKLVSDLDDISITDAPSPYGIIKAY
ncbi:hypothetical protein [Francisella uliginis]|uniref:Uncharacterized protein n=1 Tax=Francisella uliginis TaxID=573570 RepID=A0A1L4BQP3_9GAMM|nr:hypothetical protein [Francisella uliginis]API86156.1 hypothetical protein F7310_01765 [Francisella uliginis]